MYATRGGAPASHMNRLTTPGQYYDQVKSQPGKARGKGGRPMKAMKGDFREQQATPYHMDPEVPHIKNPKPVANDLLRELLTAPGGLDKMSQSQLQKLAWARSIKTRNREGAQRKVSEYVHELRQQDDENDLPLIEMQQDFNLSLKSLLRPRFI